MSEKNSLLFKGQVGSLDGVIEGYAAGWAWDSFTPDEPVYVDIYINGELYKTVKADQFRPDLLEAGIGNGVHSFAYPLEPEILSSNYIISVRFAGIGSELANSPIWGNSAGKLQPNCNLTTLKIDPYNIKFSLENLKAAQIKHLLIDINDTCNADCVYCPNVRSRQKIELEEFQNLLDKCLENVDTFQMGCGQEPTADMRLPEFYKALHNSKLRPKRITMITNATLLHRHDVSLFRDCGLTDLQISLDTVNSEINAITRRGTEVSQISKNLQYFREKCPDLGVVFSVVINSLTIGGVEALLDFGDSFGVSQYYFREIFDHCPPMLPSRNNDYQDWMKKLTLQPGEFQEMQNRLINHRSFGKITFIPAEILGSVLQDMKEADHSVRVF